MALKVGDVVIVLKDGSVGQVIKKGMFGWHVRVGEWVRYPIFANDVKLVEPETKLTGESESAYAVRIAKHFGKQA